MKRRGWIRIGIVATVLWVGIGAFWGYKVGNHEREQYAFSNQFACLETNSDSVCYQEYWKRWHERDEHVIGYTTLYAVAPLPLFWLAAYGIFGLACWIRTGFREA